MEKWGSGSGGAVKEERRIRDKKSKRENETIRRRAHCGYRISNLATESVVKLATVF